MNHLNLKPQLFFVFAIIFSPFQNVGAQTSADSLKPINGITTGQYIALCHDYFDEANYDACLSTCDTILKYKPDAAQAYNLKGTVYLKEHMCDSAIFNERQAVIIDSALKHPHEVLWEAYFSLNKSHAAYREALALCRIDPADYAGEWKRILSKSQQLQELISYAIIAFFALVWCSLFLLFHFKRKRPAEGMSTMEMILIPASVTFGFYLLFYHFSALIRSTNIHYPTQDYNPVVIRDFTFDHDGIEGFVLYVLFLAVVSLSVFCFHLLRKIRNKVVYSLLLTASGEATLALLIHIGFYPPYASMVGEWRYFFLALAYVALVWIAALLATRYPRIAVVIVSMLLVPVSFVALGPLSVYDYSYILSPAYRLWWGDSIQDIYFQYDLYMSLMALVFLKLRIDAFNFVYMAQAGYYVFFLALYLFARKFFYHKNLSFLFLVFVVFFRFYANMDPEGSFQITPWRLDLWLVLLVLVYWRGAYHWSVGLFAGLLLIFHRNFGFIYLAAYLQLLLFLACIELAKARSLPEIFDAIRDIVGRCLPCIVIICLSLVASYLLLGGLVPKSALAYQQIGIGMIPISHQSFYWYVPVLLGGILILLFRYRDRLRSNYFITGVFLVLLTIGNSLYFFGRSHEHNIINLSGILSLCLFLFIDLIGLGIYPMTDSKTILRIKKYTYACLPLFAIGVLYFFNVIAVQSKIEKQVQNIKEHKFSYPVQMDYDFNSLKSLTGNSDKVYFLDFWKDFQYYYTGHYKPMGYFSPNDAWVLKKDQAAMLQNLLDSGYYIAVPDYSGADEILALLDYNHYRENGTCRVYFKSTCSSALPVTQNVSLYRALMDKTPPIGVETPAQKIPDEFTIQCVFKTDTTGQPAHPVLFSNLHTTVGYQGLSLRFGDSKTEDVIFTYGIGSGMDSIGPLPINKGGINYIAITAGDGWVTVYINGRKEYEKPFKEKIADSDRPFIIGNTAKRDTRLNGWIYEVQISAGAMDRIAQTEKRIPGWRY